MSQIIRTPRSRLDASDIWLYIAEHGSVAAADRMADKIDAALQMLARHPHAGVAQSQFRADLRSFVVDNYVIFYTPITDGIEVQRIVHGARDLEGLI